MSTLGTRTAGRGRPRGPGPWRASAAWGPGARGGPDDRRERVGTAVVGVAVVVPRGAHRRRGPLAVGDAAGLARAVGDRRQRRDIARLQQVLQRDLLVSGEVSEGPGEHAERRGGGRRVLGIRTPGRRRGEIRAV